MLRVRPPSKPSSTTPSSLPASIRRSRPLRALPVLLVFLALAVPGSVSPGVAVAQEPERPAAETEASSMSDGTPDGMPAEMPVGIFSDQLAVDLVTVEVWVTDRDGEPVLDLEADDFRLLEDGREREITHFARVVAGSATEPEGAAGGSSSPIVAAAAVAPTVAGPARPPGQRIVLYLDDTNLQPGGRNQLLGDLATWVETGSTSGEGTSAEGRNPAVTTADLDAELALMHDDGSLVSSVDFTREPAVLVAELRRIAEDTPTDALTRLSQGRQAFREINEIYRTFLPAGSGSGGTRGPGQGSAGSAMDPCQDGYPAMMGVATGYASTVANGLAVTLDGLSNAVGALAGVPGDKVLLYAGHGLALRPGLEVFQYVGILCPDRQTDVLKEASRWDASSAYNQLAARANANGVTLYTLETAGLEVSSSASVDFEAPPSEAGIGGQSMVQLDQVRRANRQSGLYQLANETGGRAILSANRFVEPLDGVAEDLAGYYSLAFEPTEGIEGRVRLLDVEVESDGRRGLRLRHRRSYLYKGPDQRLMERLQGTVLFDLEDNPLGASLAFGPGEPVAHGVLRVPVEIRVPLERLTLLPDGDFHRGTVRLVISGRSHEQGSWRPPRQKQIPVRLAGDTVADAGSASTHTFVVEVDLTVGTHDVAVAVVDDLGGVVSYLSRELTVPGGAPGASAGAD